MKRTGLTITALAAVAALVMSGCSGGDKGKPGEETKAPAASKASEAPKADDKNTDDNKGGGIKELDIGDSGPQVADMLNVEGKYFQAIDLEHGAMQMPPASESDMHFEIDVKTNEKAKEIGYEPDQFMPYLKIKAKLTEKKTGEVVDLGTLMPMIASDGPHYGNNIKLKPGFYKVELTINSPADDFMLHTGKDSSGVKGRFWKEPLKVVFDNWEWDGQLL